MSKPRKDPSIIELKTGNDTLDELLRGGLHINSDLGKHGIVVVIRGEGGTGKTTLALQMTHALSYSYRNIVTTEKKDEIEQAKKDLEVETKEGNPIVEQKEEIAPNIGYIKHAKWFPIKETQEKLNEYHEKWNEYKEEQDSFKENPEQKKPERGYKEIPKPPPRYGLFSSTENTSDDILKRLSRLIVAKDLEDSCQALGYPYALPEPVVEESEEFNKVLVRWDFQEKQHILRCWEVKDLLVLEMNKSCSEKCYHLAASKKDRIRARKFQIFYRKKSYVDENKKEIKLTPPISIDYPTYDTTKGSLDPQYDRFTAFCHLFSRFLTAPNCKETFKHKGPKKDKKDTKRRLREIRNKIEEEKSAVINEIAKHYEKDIVEPLIQFGGIGSQVQDIEIQPTDTATAVHHIQTRINTFREKSKSALRETPLVFTIDGLGAMVPEERNNQLFSSLISNLRATVPLTIITLEDSGAPSNYIDHQADLVILMRANETTKPIHYLIHEMQITKSRYQTVAYGWHQYKMRNWGAVIFPSSHFMLHQFNYVPQQYIKSYSHIQINEKFNSNEQRKPYDYYVSIIEGILGFTSGNREKSSGSTIALMGSRGCFKTALSIDFLTSGGMGVQRKRDAENKWNSFPSESGLIVSLIDDEYYIRESMICQRRGSCKEACTFVDRNFVRFSRSKKHPICSCRECASRISQFYQRTGCITSSELLFNLRARILKEKEYEDAKTEEETKMNGAPLQKPGEDIDRMVFWDVTQLDYRFPFLSDDPLFVPALFDLVKKKKGMRGLFMGSMNAKNSGVISTIADNIIFAWRDRLEVKEYDEYNNKVEEPPKTDPKTEGMKRLRSGDCLLLFVDRTEGTIGRDNKALYWFPIGTRVKAKPSITPKDVELQKEGDSLAIETEPTGEKGNSIPTIILPDIPWKPAEYKVPRELWAKFSKSEDMIKEIEKLQGL